MLRLSQYQFSELTGIPRKQIIELEKDDNKLSKQNIALLKILEFIYDNHLFDKYLIK